MPTLPGTESNRIVQELDDIQNLDTNAPFVPEKPAQGSIRTTEPPPETTPLVELNKPQVPEDPAPLSKPIQPPVVEPTQEEVPTITLTKRPPNVIQLELLKQQAAERQSREDQLKSFKQQAVFRGAADTRGGVAEAVSDILLDPISDVAAIVLNLLLDPASMFQEGSNGQNLGREIQHGLNGLYKAFGLEPLTAEETGLDKGIPTDGFSSLFQLPIFPGTSQESFFDLTPLIPPGEAEFGNVGTQERSRRFYEAKESATAIMLSPLFRLFKFMKPIKSGDKRKLAKIKEFLRKQGEAQSDFGKLPVPGLTRPGGVPQVAVPVDKASIRNAAIDTVAGITFAFGVTAAQEQNRGGFYEMVFGTANAAFWTGLSYRTLFSYASHLNHLASLKAGVLVTSKLKEGVLGAKGRAQTLVSKTAGEGKAQAIKNLESEGKDEAGKDLFLPGFFEALGPDLKTQNQDVINLFTAFIEENADLRTVRSALHKDLSDMVLEMARTRSANTEVTEETIGKALIALDDIIQKRIKLSMEKTAATVAKVTSELTQDEANRIGVRNIVKELEYSENTEAVLWKNLDLANLRVQSSPAVGRWEQILRETGAEQGSGLLNLGAGEGKKDLYKFLGSLKERKGSFDVVLGIRNPSSQVFISGKWSKEVSMQEVQNMRSRVQRAIREERVAPAPSDNRISKLIQVSDALLATMESLTKEQLASTPNLVKLYKAAREATHTIKKRFWTGEVGEMLRIRKGGQPRAEEQGLEAIFKGAGSTKGKAGDLAIKQILETANGGPLVKGQPLTPRGLEVAQAMEELFKIRFAYHAMRGDDVISHKAETFVRNRAEALKNFPGLKADFDEVIRTNDASILQIKRYKTLQSEVKNEKLSMAAMYSTRGPKTTFDKYVSDPDRPTASMKKDIIELVRLANQDPDGMAREGLSGSLFKWMVDRSTHSQRNNLEMPEMISGFDLKHLWDSQPIQVAAKIIFTEDDHIFMQQLLKSAEALDRGVLSHAGKAGSADLKPDKMIENILRVIVLDKFPLARGGGGSIAKQTIISKGVRDLMHKYYRNPAHAILVDAFMSKNKDLLRSLFDDILTEEDAKRAAIQFNTWLQSGLLNLGVREVREERKE
jgi:hypothetical protein